MLFRGYPRRKHSRSSARDEAAMETDMGSEKPAELCIGDIFRRNSEDVPHRCAASLGTSRLTYRELDEAGNRMARQLSEAGIGRGDRVVTWADTCLEVLPLFVGLAKLGAIFAPINAGYGVTEAAPVAQLARAHLLVTDAEHSARAHQLAELGHVPLLGSLLSDKDNQPALELQGIAETRAFSADHYDEAALRERDPHVIFFTSGSTGQPKGVVLSHRANWLRSFHGVFRDEPEISVCMFPLFHMAAFTLGLSAWQTRGEVAFVRNPTAENLMQTVQERKANRLYCIPAVWRRILSEDTTRWKTGSLREIDTGTSATPVELLAELKQRFPATVLRVYYGSTEVGAGTCLANADLLRKPGSVGLPASGVQLRLGESDEICLRSPYLTDGYFEDPEATKATLRNGWFHTGDIGCLDEEGYLSVVGRLKEIIRSGGESIAPAEVEEVLATHEDIEEVAVVGIPDSEWGEIVCAAVVSRAGARPSLEKLQALCEGLLAGYKKPRRLALVDSLPRTAATGQVQRSLLVEIISAGGS